MKEATVFMPCLINYYFPETGHSIVRLLEHLGITVHITENQGCCGYPFLQEGNKQATKEIAQKFLFDFQTGKRDHKTVLCSSHCEYTVNQSYPRIFHNSVSHNLCSKVLTTVTGIWDVLLERGINYNPKEKKGLVVDCLCDLEKLGKITGFEKEDTNWILLNQGYTCCGGGSGLPKSNYLKSEKMMQSLFDFAKKNNLNSLVFTDDLCMLHASQIAIKQGLDIQIQHLLDLISKSYVRN
jgi:L-lactate dehydrogenase complex protein LldE